MGNNKEAPRPIVNPEQRAHSAIRFIFNEHVGRKDLPQINHHMRRLGDCVHLLRQQGKDPTELLDVLQEEMGKVGERLPTYKGGLAGKIISIIMGERLPKI